MVECIIDFLYLEVKIKTLNIQIDSFHFPCNGGGVDLFVSIVLFKRFFEQGDVTIMGQRVN